MHQSLGKHLCIELLKHIFVLDVLEDHHLAKPEKEHISEINSQADYLWLPPGAKDCLVLGGPVHSPVVSINSPQNVYNKYCHPFLESQWIKLDLVARSKVLGLERWLSGLEYLLFIQRT